MRKSFLQLESDSEEELKNVSINLYVIGKQKVGKTSFIKRLLYNEFSFSYVPTRAVEIYKEKTFHTLGLNLTLQFFDIPHNFVLKNTNPNDVMVVFVIDELPSIPKIPIRTWLLYREKTFPICPKNRQIHIDNLENTGFVAFINSLVVEYS